VGIEALPTECVKTLVERVARCYPDNDFHCFTHACDVSISAFVLLTKFGGMAWLRPVDCLTLLVSALTHDAGHPGKTNAFEKQTQSDLVKRYGEVRSRPIIIPARDFYGWMPAIHSVRASLLCTDLLCGCACRWAHMRGCTWRRQRASSARQTAMYLRLRVSLRRTKHGRWSYWSTRCLGRI
jgi:hypothetical protein